MSLRNKPLTGWRYVGYVGSILGFIGASAYAVIIYPMMNIDSYRKEQQKNRAGLDIEKIQPGGMKVWTDPFERDSKKKAH